jgi:phosphoserine phosphatase RsbU/P
MDKDALFARLMKLEQRLIEVEADKADLQVLLDTVTEHSTNLENQLLAQQQALLTYFKQVDKVTAAAAAFEGNTFEPQMLHEVALRADALGRLARVFQDMVVQVQAREQLFKQQVLYEQILKELEAAHSIQTSILPQRQPLFPEHPQVDVHGAMLPAKEVGGDFFDAFALDSDQIFIAIGDVSGKGIPAALFMIRTLTLLRLSLTNADLLAPQQLGRLIEGINRVLCEGNDRCMFVTLFAGLFNVKTGVLTYVNGGHNPPFWASQGATFNRLPMPKGVLLGVFDEGITFEAAEFAFQPGDALVLYTDGITEAEQSPGHFFQEERAMAVLSRLKASSTAHDLVEGLTKAVFSFAGEAPQSDDLTVLALRYLGDLCA